MCSASLSSNSSINTSVIKAVPTTSSSQAQDSPAPKRRKASRFGPKVDDEPSFENSANAEPLVNSGSERSLSRRTKQKTETKVQEEVNEPTVSSSSIEDGSGDYDHSTKNSTGSALASDVNKPLKVSITVLQYICVKRISSILLHLFAYMNKN